MSDPVIILATDTKVMGYGESDSSGCWIKFQLLPEHMAAIRGRRGEIVDIVIAEPEERAGEPIAPPTTAKPVKGPHGEAWAALYRSGWWQCPDAWPLFGTDQQYNDWIKTKPCAIEGHGVHEGDVVAAHVRRIAAGAGTGIKPAYSTIPMCYRHHILLQHQKGESAVGGKEALDKLLLQYRMQWIKQGIYEMFEVDSLSHVSPDMFTDLVRRETDGGVAYVALPKEFKK